MLKSRMLIGGILVFSIAASVAGVTFLNREHSRELSAVTVESKTIPETTAPSIGLQYAVELSDSPVELSATRLDSSADTEIFHLPSTEVYEQGAPIAGIDYKDVLDSSADTSAEQLESDESMDDGFVFDINQTIFPVTDEEVEMLKYVIQAEAGGASLESKRIYTLSITNRILCGRFQDTLYEVLHARNQFSTINNYYTKAKVPDANTCRAVEEVLMGACEDNSQNCLYFYCTNYPVAEDVVAWFEEDLKYLYTIGCDRFFTDPF